MLNLKISESIDRAAISLILLLSLAIGLLMIGGGRILFSASEWSSYKPGLFEQSLYTVTTGRNADLAQQPGTIQQILGNQDCRVLIVGNN